MTKVYTGSAVSGGAVQSSPYVTRAEFQLGQLGASLPQFTTAMRPTADASWRGKLITVKDPGAVEEVQTVLTTSDGGFAWITVAVASL